jgi:SAM-dependent methyltransferase
MSTPTYAGNGYDDVHAKRFELSLAQILYNVPPSEGFKGRARILELGGGGKFTEMLRAAGYYVVVAGGDYRYGIEIDPNEGMFDAVIAMEVFEHVHDQDNLNGTPTEWRGSGTEEMLRLCRLYLAPHGWFFLTTPNADSLNVINKVIHRQAPMVYRPHVREYTVHELVELVRKANFDVTHVETHECWGNSMSPHMRAEITRLLVSNFGVAGLAHRGEDIFLWAKPRLSH